MEISGDASKIVEMPNRTEDTVAPRVSQQFMVPSVVMHSSLSFNRREYPCVPRTALTATHARKPSSIAFLPGRWGGTTRARARALARVRSEINDRRNSVPRKKDLQFIARRRNPANWSRLRGMWAPLLRACTFGVTDLREKSV